MTNRFFAALIFITAFLCLPHAAMAQNCSLNKEAIFKLRAPSIGAYNIWDSVHGDIDLDEKYVSGTTLENSYLLAAGERQRKNSTHISLILAEIDRRGRIVWEKQHDIAKFERIHKIFREGEQLIVLADVNQGKKKTAAWIGFFDLTGDLKRQKTLTHSSGTLRAHDIIRSSNGNDFLLAASISDGASGDKRSSVIYRLNSKAQFISKRSYMPGPDNRIESLHLLEDDRVLAAGFMDDANGRRMGWVMVVDEDGSVVWQRQYPRGAGAQIKRAIPFAKDYFAIIGDAFPAVVDGKTAGWLMVVDKTNGTIAWQRYFTGDFDYTAQDIMANDTGLISLLLDAIASQSPQGKIKKDLVRLVTLNPRGVIFDMDDFFHGKAAQGYDLTAGYSNERIIVGASEMEYVIEDASESGNTLNMKKHSQEGWAVAVPRMADYNDPCAAKQFRVPN